MKGAGSLPVLCGGGNCAAPLTCTQRAPRLLCPSCSPPSHLDQLNVEQQRLVDHALVLQYKAQRALA